MRPQLLRDLGHALYTCSLKAVPCGCAQANSPAKTMGWKCVHRTEHGSVHVAVYQHVVLILIHTQDKWQLPPSFCPELLRLTADP